MCVYPRRRRLPSLDFARLRKNQSDREVVQARNCVLVAPNEYVLSGLLRGCLGSAHAMQSPHPIGARIVVIDQRLARFEVGAHEWNESFIVACPPYGLLATDARATTASLTLPHAAARPWAPAHVRAKRTAGGDVAISWIRCARIGGDAWGPGEPPLSDGAEAYQVDIFSGSAVIRSLVTTTPSYLYTAAQQSTDFGGSVSSLHFRVAQLDSAQAPGLNTELTVTL